MHRKAWRTKNSLKLFALLCTSAYQSSICISLLTSSTPAHACDSSIRSQNKCRDLVYFYVFLWCSRATLKLRSGFDDIAKHRNCTKQNERTAQNSGSSVYIWNNGMKQHNQESRAWNRSKHKHMLHWNALKLCGAARNMCWITVEFGWNLVFPVFSGPRSCAKALFHCSRTGELACVFLPYLFLPRTLSWTSHLPGEMFV